MEHLNSSRSSPSSDGIEQQQQVQMQQQRPQFDVLEHMPHLTDPSAFAAMKTTVSKVTRTRSVLQTLGDRPDHEAMDIARARMAKIDDALYRNLEDIHQAQRSSDMDVVSWGADGGVSLLSMGAALFVNAPATLVMWITVLVLLAFTGKPRRMLVMEGRRITKDIASLAFKNLHWNKEFTRD